MELCREGRQLGFFISCRLITGAHGLSFDRCSRGNRKEKILAVFARSCTWLAFFGNYFIYSYFVIGGQVDSARVYRKQIQYFETQCCGENAQFSPEKAMSPILSRE